ncbi:MAG: acyltransferase family protein [Muribaculaceae bacterium]|nr:acyltransferase family protein [Muribaculaceae bacterium]
MARDIRLDSLKGLLIILVILGHVITDIGNKSLLNHGVMGIIYIFHMPLFILISGYLTKHPSQQTAKEMWTGVGRILVTLVTFHTLMSFRVYLIEGVFKLPFFKFPFGILWYLLCLIYWRIALYFTPRTILNKPGLYLGIAFLLSLSCGLFHLGTFLSIQRTLNFFFFFLLGFYYRHGYISHGLWHNNRLHAITAIVMLPLIFWLYPHCGNVMNGTDYYGIAGLPEKIMILVCSTVVSLIVFNLMREYKPLSDIGKNSLFYYVYHTFFITVVVYPIVRDYQFPCSFPFVILYTAIIITMLWILNKVKFFRWLVHPNLKFIKQQSS